MSGDPLKEWWDEDADRVNALAEAARKFAAKVLADEDEESRSADCGRDDGGKFGDGNDCAAGGGGGSSAPGAAASGGGDPQKVTYQESPVDLPPPVQNSDIAKLLKAISQSPDGFSLDPASAEQPPDGIMVSEFANDSKRSVKIKADALFGAEGVRKFAKWFSDNDDMLKGQSDKFVGGWKTAEGDFYIDIATRFPPDQAEKALDAGRKAEQLAVFNLGTFKETWVKYDEGDSRKPKEWDRGFSAARTKAATEQVYNPDSPSLDEEDHASELSKHGKKSVREYHGVDTETREGGSHGRRRSGAEVRRADEGHSHRGLSGVSDISRGGGEVAGEEVGPGVVRGRSAGEAGTVQRPAAVERLVESAHAVAAEIRGDSDCLKDDDGRFTTNNKCQEGAGTGSSPEPVAAPPSPPPREQWSPGKPVSSLTNDAVNNPPVRRTDDGRRIIARPDGVGIFKFAGREFTKTDEVARLFSEQQSATRGVLIDSRKKLSSANAAYLVESHVKQTQDAMARGIRPAFYSPEERSRQVVVFGEMVPQVLGGRTATGAMIEAEDAEHIFRVLQALTSPNATPFGNMQRTRALMEKFFTGDGRLTTSTNFGVTAGSIKKSLSRYQTLVDTLGRRTDGSIDTSAGVRRANELLTGKTMRAGDVDDFFREVTGGDKGEWKASNYLVGERVPVFCAFGPKVGTFFANNNGELDHLTADVWYTRTWGRQTGELIIPVNPDSGKKRATALLKVAKKASADQLHGHDGNQLLASIEQMKKTGAPDGVVLSWASARLKHYAKGGFKEKKGTGGALNRLAKSVAESDGALLGDPATATMRSNMISVAGESAKRVGQPVAYMQDILWQDEQDAYAAYGAKTATSVGALSLYSGVIQDLAKRPKSWVKAESEKRSESFDQEEYDDYERGGREQILFEEALADVPDEVFVETLIKYLDRSTESRSEDCGRQDGGKFGQGNDCASEDGSPTISGVSSVAITSGKQWRRVDDITRFTGKDIPMKSLSEVKSVAIFHGKLLSDSLKAVGVTLDEASKVCGSPLPGSDVMIMHGTLDESNAYLDNPAANPDPKNSVTFFSKVRVDGVDGAVAVGATLSRYEEDYLTLQYGMLDVTEEAKASSPVSIARQMMRSVADSISEAEKIGVDEIKMLAAGSAKDDSKFRGYRIWPRMGFDGEIPRKYVTSTWSAKAGFFNSYGSKIPDKILSPQALKEKKAGKLTVQALYETREGQEWWEANGGEMSMSLYVGQDNELGWQRFSKMRDRYTSRSMSDIEFIDWMDAEWRSIRQEVEQRSDDCGRQEGGRFGQGNDCAGESGGSQPDGWSGNESILWPASSRETAPPPFDGAEDYGTVSISAPAKVRDSLKQSGLSIDDAVTIAGGAPGSDVFVRPAPDFPDAGQSPILFAFQRDLAGVKDGVSSSSVVSSDATGGAVVYHSTMTVADAVKADPVKRHAAAREFYRTMVSSVEAARKSGVSRISLSAAGNSSANKGDATDWKGYTIWPRMGFNAKIPPQLKAKLPPELSNAETLLDLHATREGTKWWAQNGEEVEVSLDLRDKKSPQNQVFDRFVRHFSESRRDMPLGSGDEWLSPEDLLRLDEMWSEIWDSELLDDYSGQEDRAFCPTGENRDDCVKDDAGRFAKDNKCQEGDGGGSSPEPVAASGDSGRSSWGGEPASWGKDSGTEIWTPDRPLFRGSDGIGEIRINRASDVREIVQDSLKLNVSDVLLASGAVVNSPDRVGMSKARVVITPSVDDSVEVSWFSKGRSKGGEIVNAADASRSIHSVNGRSVLAQNTFFIHRDFQGKGIALESVLRMTSTPVDRITMTAARDDSTRAPEYRMNGYAHWPRYGYDAPISKVKEAIALSHSYGVASSPDIPKEFAKAKTLLDIYAIPGGREWWTQSGGDISLSFDTRSGSRSRAVLMAEHDKANKRFPEGRSADLSLPEGEIDEEVILDEVWGQIQKNGLKGDAPTDEEWSEWDAEDAEIKRRKNVDA